MPKSRNKQTRQKESHYVPKQTRQRESNSAPKITKEVIGVAAIEDRHLVWRFSERDQAGPFSCDEMSAADQRILLDRMSAFEQMTPGELKKAQSNKDVPLYSMSKKAKDRLRELQLDDQDKLWSFHVGNKPRFWCIKHENIYALLWWDPSHEVYLTPKKHT